MEELSYLKMIPTEITPISECSDPFTCFHWHKPWDMTKLLRRRKDLKHDINSPEPLAVTEEPTPAVVEDIYADDSEEMIMELDPFQLVQDVKPRNLTQMNKKTPYQCKTCDKEIRDICSLRKHEATHLEVRDRPYSCVQCDKRFIHKETRDRHIEIMHLKIKHYCPECGKGFSTHQNMVNHSRSHTNTKPFSCKICGKQFRDRSNWNQHRRIAHSHARPYKCSHCDMTFRYIHHMKRHRLTHLSPAERLKMELKYKSLSREKKFECPKCPKKFRDRFDVEKHQVVHTGEKPFPCTLCDRTFPSAGNLNHHLKRVHLGQKPFECLTCRKKFSFSSELKMHEKVHTGEKPYKCQKCKRCFSTGRELRQHKRCEVKPPMKSEVKLPRKSEIKPPLKSEVKHSLKSEVKSPLKSEVADKNISIPEDFFEEADW